MKNRQSRKKGMVLVLTLVVLTMVSVITLSITSFTAYGTKMVRDELSYTMARYAAEGGVYKTLWQVGKCDDKETPMDYSVNVDGRSLPVDVTVSLNPNYTDIYEVKAVAEMNGRKATLRSAIKYQPPSLIFDHAYFINNWGWFYGNTITAWGNVRSNGPFSFGGYKPKIHGDIYSGFDIHDSGNLTGNPDLYPDSKKLSMPYVMQVLSDNAAAGNLDGTLKQGNSLLFSGTLGDDSGEKKNVYLEGTSSNPINIDGQVYIEGDVILKGVISGQGTLYTGGNLYVIGDVEYEDGPNRNVPDNNGNKWGYIESNLDKDMVCFAANGSIIMGNHLDSSWRNSVDNYVEVGAGNFNDTSEYRVGKDGIPNSGDEETSPYDVDGDGVIEGRMSLDDFDFSSTLSQTNYWMLPSDLRSESYYKKYVPRNALETMDGIYYSSHFLAGSCGYQATWKGSYWSYKSKGCTNFGALISRNEAVVDFGKSYNMMHDPRLSSQYYGMEKVQELMDKMGLPCSELPAAVVVWFE